MENDSINARNEARRKVFRFASRLFTVILIITLVAGMVLAAKSGNWNTLITACIILASVNAWFASFLGNISRGNTEKFFAAYRAMIISVFTGVLFALILLALVSKGGA